MRQSRHAIPRCGTADRGNREKFSDELLKDLIEGFSDIRLGNTAVSADVLGDAYECLIGKFADVTRRNKAGEFYTPRSVVRMMVEILAPKRAKASMTRPAERAVCCLARLSTSCTIRRP